MGYYCSECGKKKERYEGKRCWECYTNKSGARFIGKHGERMKRKRAETKEKSK